MFVTNPFTLFGGDTEAPTAPVLDPVTVDSDVAITLDWSASTDDTGVTNYQYRIDGGAWVSVGLVLTYQVTGLIASTEYDFEVRARDLAGNASAPSNLESGTTMAPIPFDPTDLGSKLWGMYEADSYSQADGSNIVTDWADQSGNGNDLAPVITPTFETNELNGLPIVRSTTHGFDIPDMSALTSGAIYIVWKVNNTGTGGGSNLGTGTTSFYPFTGNGLIYDSFGSNTRKEAITSGVTLTNWHVLHIWSKTNDWGMAQDGSVIRTENPNTVAFPAAPRLGSNGSSMDVDIAAIYILSDKPTGAENTSMLGYINDKWGV